MKNIFYDSIYPRSILMKEVVQDRIPMLSQLVNGLKVCGVLGSIQAHPDQMRAHFCIANASKDQLDNEKFNNLILVQFSNEQQKKALEINTYKYFSDFIDKLYHQGTFVNYLIMYCYYFFVLYSDLFLE